MAKNTQQNNPPRAERRENAVEARTIVGVRFEIDATGFVRSSAGEIGHLEDCQSVAEFFAAFLALDDTDSQA